MSLFSHLRRFSPVLVFSLVCLQAHKLVYMLFCLLSMDLGA